MALSKTSGAYAAITEAKLPLTEGVVVSIDPSIGSSSSMPGYAVYVKGRLSTSGTFDMDINASMPLRSQQLAYYMRKLYNLYDPDVLVYEEIPLTGVGRHIASHISLLKAVGIILSVSGPDYYIGMYPRSWKALARPGYVKSDVNDAIEIGYVAITQAEEIISQEGMKEKKRYGK